jgi:membrane protease YdiL (CAAX protease family)
MLQMMNTPGGYAVICLLAPIAEEMVFRGAALRTLLEWKPERRWLMITLSALLFALAHMNPAQFIHPFLIGLLLGWMYERTGSIIPGIIYHWANNTVAYLLARIYQDPDVGITDIFGSQSHALMAVGFSLLIFIPAIYQLNLWMKKQ